MEVCRGVCCVGESGEGRGYPARDEGKLDVMDVVWCGGEVSNVHWILGS